MLIFHVFTWWFYRHGKTWWNMFTYFCCKWFFTNIFATIHFFLSKIQNIQDFLYRSNSNILKRHYNIRRYIVLHTFLSKSSLFFVLNQWRQLKRLKVLSFFDFFPLNTADNFFYYNIITSFSVRNHWMNNLCFTNELCF